MVIGNKAFHSKLILLYFQDNLMQYADELLFGEDHNE